MKPKQKRAAYILILLACIGTATALVLSALGDNLTFFYGPSEVEYRQIEPDKVFRLGGVVKEGSVHHLPGTAITDFVITDYQAELPVRYEGLIPNLFREGQGVIATGSLNFDRVFIATQLLAKHDENYMPPEVAETLKTPYSEQQ